MNVRQALMTDDTQAASSTPQITTPQISKRITVGGAATEIIYLREEGKPARLLPRRHRVEM